MASADHLDHPESWTTGDEDATTKQKDFIKILGGNTSPSMSKSEASATIDKLKKEQPEQTAATGGEEAEAKASDADASAPLTDPKNWATGDEPATNKQMRYIAVMAKDAGEPIPDDLNKSEASEKITDLKAKTGK